MNRSCLALGLITVLLGASSTLAQERPPRRPDGPEQVRGRDRSRGPGERTAGPDRLAGGPHRLAGGPDRLAGELRAIQEMVERLEAEDGSAKREIIDRLERIRGFLSRDAGRRPEHPERHGDPGEHARGDRRQRDHDPREAERLGDEMAKIETAIAEHQASGRDAPPELLRAQKRLAHRLGELREGLGELREGGDRDSRHRGAGGPRWRGRAGRSGPPPDRKTIEEAFEIFAQIAPEQAQEAREHWKNNPDAIPYPMFSEMRKLHHLREHDPEAFERAVAGRKLESEARHMAERARHVKGEERERLANELRGHLNELFEIRMRNRDAKISRMQSELEKLRHDQEQRREQRDELIQRRFEEMLGEALF